MFSLLLLVTLKPMVQPNKICESLYRAQVWNTILQTVKQTHKNLWHRGLEILARPPTSHFRLFQGSHTAPEWLQLLSIGVEMLIKLFFCSMSNAKLAPKEAGLLQPEQSYFNWNWSKLLLLWKTVSMGEFVFAFPLWGAHGMKLELWVYFFFNFLFSLNQNVHLRWPEKMVEMFRHLWRSKKDVKNFLHCM